MGMSLYHPIFRGLTFIAAQNLGSFRIFFDVFNNVDQVGNLGEEWVIVREGHHLFMVIAGPSDIKCRLNIGIDKSIGGSERNRKPQI